MGGCIVSDGDAPRLLESGRPDIRLVLMRGGEVEVIDTWSVSGLRATGSHDIAVDGLAVPAARSASLITDRAARARAAVRVPALRPARRRRSPRSRSGSPAARSTTSASWPGAKTPTLSTRKLAERAGDPVGSARAEAGPARGARAAVRERPAAPGTRPSPGGAIPIELRAGLRLASTHAVEAAAGAVDAAYSLAGGTRDLRDGPAPASLSRRPRRDPAHARRPGHLGARRALAARARARRLAAVSGLRSPADDISTSTGSGVLGAVGPRRPRSRPRSGRAGARGRTRLPGRPRTAPGGRPRTRTARARPGRWSRWRASSGSARGPASSPAWRRRAIRALILASSPIRFGIHSSP